MLSCESQHQKVLTFIKSHIDSSLPFQEEVNQSLQQSISCSQKINLASTMVVLFDQDSEDFWKIVSAVECLSMAAWLHGQAKIPIASRHHHQQILWQTSGEAQVLSGDYLLALVLKMVSNLQRWDLLKLITTTTSMLALGQSQELSLEQTSTRYLQMIQNRFAYLFATVSKSASMILTHDDSRQESLFKYGLLFGTIVSLKDMLLLENYYKELSIQVNQILDEMQSCFSSKIEILSDLLQEAMTP